MAILASALIVPATGFAVHTFPDVPDGQYYTEPVEWAFDNGITQGTTATTFEPNGPVTRAQNVTFTWRYDRYVVLPALADIETNVATVAGDVANATRVYFARVTSEGNPSRSVIPSPDGVKPRVAARGHAVFGSSPSPAAPTSWVRGLRQWRR